MAKVWYAHVTESHICFSQRLGEEKQEAHREHGAWQVFVLGRLHSVLLHYKAS